MVCDARFHGRGDSQRLVNADKIVVHEMEGNRRFVVLDLL